MATLIAAVSPEPWTLTLSGLTGRYSRSQPAPWKRRTGSHASHMALKGALNDAGAPEEPATNAAWMSALVASGMLCAPGQRRAVVGQPGPPGLCRMEGDLHPHAVYLM